MSLAERERVRETAREEEKEKENAYRFILFTEFCDHVLLNRV